MARESTAKKEKAPPPAMGGNISGVLEAVAKARDRIIGIDHKIKELQADKKAIRESMEAKGITKAAFDKALSYFRQDPEQRSGFDQSYAIAREGMGLPIKGMQMDMFKEPEKASAPAPAAEPEQGDTEDDENDGFAVSKVVGK